MHQVWLVKSFGSRDNVVREAVVAVCATEAAADAAVKSYDERVRADKESGYAWVDGPHRVME